MSEIQLSRAQARRLILYIQGLLGDYRFKGKRGALDYIRQAGCIQFDPIDVCGRNAELVLQARVEGFTRRMLGELLYTDRKLLDYFDKNLSIIPIENWKYFERERDRHRIRERSFDEIKQVCDEIMTTIAKKGPVCSADLHFKQKVDWYWSATKLSRAALEHLYFRGALAIHHKVGNIKYYDLIERCVPQAILDEPEPYPDDDEHRKWRVLQRIGAVGLLWNRASDAWLGIPGLKAGERNAAFEGLLAEGKIVPVRVEGIRDLLYARAQDADLLGASQRAGGVERCAFIAPLDNMMWDRKLVRAIWDFDYKWEIYTPQAERKYGYYVLPVLHGERLVGRIEAAYDRKSAKLNVLNLWYEPDVRRGKTLEADVAKAIERFGAWNATL